jgi:catechol 2,3-dioxygenase-like lactoylglutathione lyase family enzyme
MWHSIPMATMEPVPSEYAEVEGDIEKGLDPMSGYRYVDPMPAKYAVDGVNLGRPFKITRIGPVNLFVDDIAATRDYYRDVLGFTPTEDVDYQGEKCVFLRCDNEHHSLGLFPKGLRSKLGLKPDSSNMSFGLQLANYRQLKDAVAFLRENGVRVETEIIPPELHPGIDYAAYVQDPDGHLVQLYYYMEQVGWDGKPRPKDRRRRVSSEWPETLEPLSDTYMDQVYQGPLG